MCEHCGLGGIEQERYTPVTGSLETRVVIPLAVAGITGGLAATAGWMGTVLLFDAPMLHAAKVCIPMGFAFTFATWLVQAISDRNLLVSLERVYHHAEQAAHTMAQRVIAEGEPQPVAQPLRLELVTRNDGGYSRTQLIDLPVTEAQLRAIAKGVIRDNRPLSGREWQGDVPTFPKLRAKMVELGWAAWRQGGPQQGVELTEQGRVLFQHLANNGALA